ncbi:MAG TPA: M23 family metallopeptidase [Clostridia bacterium]|jgi:hypothetical protein
MKYDSIKKAHAKISSNRYIYYEPIIKPPQEDDKPGLLYSLTIRLFICGFIFMFLLLTSQIPFLKNISSSVKSAVSYNMKIFKIEQAGASPLFEKIGALADNSPLEFQLPLQTQNIIIEGQIARLNINKNPLVYSAEKGVVAEISREGNVATIEIRHRNNTVTKYSGVQFCGVRVGQTVNKGFPIGILAGEELEFSIYEDGKQVLVDKAIWD